METNKQKAQIYHTAVSEYDLNTIKELVREDYIQHNPRVSTGREAFLALLPQLKNFGTKIDNIRIFQDGAYVVMHHHWRNAAPFGADEKVAFHIIRFDQRGLIAEHWSVMTDVAPLNPSGRSLIDGSTIIEDLTNTESNKARIVALFDLLVKTNTADYAGIVSKFFSPFYHQHHPNIADGVAGFIDAVTSKKLAINYQRQHKVLGSGNYVLSIGEGFQHQVPTAFYDLFRLEGNVIVEHWSVYQEIPTQNLANDNTMFNFDINR